MRRSSWIQHTETPAKSVSRILEIINRVTL